MTKRPEIAAILTLVLLISSFSIDATTAESSEGNFKNDGKILPAVIVRPKKYSSIHLIYYVREYSTMAGDYDTIRLFREKTVDFMIPVHGSKKSGWLNPRVLASRSYYRFTNYEGLDSVSDRYREHFSWSDWISLFDRIQLPEKLFSENSYEDPSTPFCTYTVVSGDDIVLTADLLKDASNRKLMPSASRLFETAGLKFLKFDTKYCLTNLEKASATPENVKRFDVDIRSENRGRVNYSASLKTKETCFVDTHAEFYMIAKEYLNKSEATQWRNKPHQSDEIEINAPEEADPLPDLYADLVNRVDNIDVAQLRINAEMDARLIGPRYNNFMTKNQSFIGRLWDKIKKLPNWLQKHI